MEVAAEVQLSLLALYGLCILGWEGIASLYSNIHKKEGEYFPLIKHLPGARLAGFVLSLINLLLGGVL